MGESEESSQPGTHDGDKIAALPVVKFKLRYRAFGSYE
jgi:hypothetical protein